MNTYAYDESGRRRWVLVAGAVLVIVVLLAVAFIAGRSTAPSGGGRAQVVNQQSGPGPTHVVNGVPAGYAHTQAGAVAAATNYLETFYGSLLIHVDRYLAAVDQMAAPDAKDRLRSLAMTNLNGTGQQNLISYAAQGRTVVDRVVPLAYRIERYDSGRADVAIWGEALIAADGALPLREGWATTIVTTEWAGDDWKLSDIPANAGSDAYGPVPIPIQAPGQSTALPSQLVQYRSYQTDAT